MEMSDNGIYLGSSEPAHATMIHASSEHSILSSTLWLIYLNFHDRPEARRTVRDLWTSLNTSLTPCGSLHDDSTTATSASRVFIIDRLSRKSITRQPAACDPIPQTRYHHFTN